MMLSLALGEQPAWPLQPLAAAAWLYLVAEWIASGVLLAGVFLIFRGKTAKNPSEKNATTE